MNWDIQEARNGEKTLLLNEINIYSRYQPLKDTKKWVMEEYNPDMCSYFLVGLGLGYHLHVLSELVGEKTIIVYYFDVQELQLFRSIQQENNWWEKSTIHLVHSLEDCTIDENTQVLIPNVWIKAIGKEHPLLPYLEDIKINQITYKKSATQMEENFFCNRLLGDFQPFPSFQKENACLVASGPSLNETINWLKEGKDKLTIFAVGSVLKMLLEHQIIPDAVVISDPKNSISSQLAETNYNGPLFYLSTANHGTVNLHKGAKYFLCQNGYPLAEKLSAEKSLPLFETGGSVATLTLSLLEYFKFNNIFLFGQDFGFAYNQTHAQLSTSGRTVETDRNIRFTQANDKSKIATTSNLSTYLRWFENKAQQMVIPIYNTAEKGARISNIPFVNREQFYSLIVND
ncbi:DUF115 domain-containing protein [Ureibacillus chungkukjangi]|uniref:motility associated factor glycosyltransferase family protein n=1 Tax=Ureibacillus chungkukjangi TaxID=1202712 RepID=UPI00203CDCAC|nr:6-hydroxymethylpterin diphosphokinase MptE-like protein [Ureibacillus chungkukjangi]MCM3389092.1 DUF115 domain-containing protein [Ureibacillus chungkukjangi]